MALSVGPRDLCACQLRATAWAPWFNRLAIIKGTASVPRPLHTACCLPAVHISLADTNWQDFSLPIQFESRHVSMESNDDTPKGEAVLLSPLCMLCCLPP